PRDQKRNSWYWRSMNRLAALSSNSTCLDFSSSLVIGNNHSGWRHQTLCYCKCSRNRAIVKQLFPFAKSQRVNFEPEFVHEVVLKEQLNELPTAMNLNVGTF